MHARTRAVAVTLVGLLAAPLAALADEPTEGGEPPAEGEPAAEGEETPPPEEGNQAAPEAPEAPPAEEEKVVIVPRRRVEVDAFIEGAYTGNFNRPTDRTNHLRIFDQVHNNFLPESELVFQLPVSAPGDAGFRIDVAMGAAVPPLSASAGLFTGENIDLQQAYVSWIARAGDGLRLDVGKFATWAGAEVISGYDGFNENYSRGFLFGFAVPFAHTGVRGTYPLSAKLGLGLMLVNGWDVALDNNSGKTWGLNLAYSGEKASVYFTYIGGPEQMGTSKLRNLVDVVAVFKASPELTLTANVDFAHEQEATATGDAATWYGAALYARYDLAGAWAVAGRAELFADPDGVRTGTADPDGLQLIGVTVTPSYAIGNSFVLRADLRMDHASVESFTTKDAMEPSANQFTLALSAVYTTAGL